MIVFMLPTTIRFSFSFFVKITHLNGVSAWGGESQIYLMLFTIQLLMCVVILLGYAKAYFSMHASPPLNTSPVQDPVSEIASVSAAPLQTYRSRNGHTHIILDGFGFSKCSTLKNGFVWMCSKLYDKGRYADRCPMTCKTTFDFHLISCSGQHDHLDQFKVEAKTERNNKKKKKET